MEYILTEREKKVYEKRYYILTDPFREECDSLKKKLKILFTHLHLQSDYGPDSVYSTLLYHLVRNHFLYWESGKHCDFIYFELRYQYFLDTEMKFRTRYDERFYVHYDFNVYIRFKVLNPDELLIMSWQLPWFNNDKIMYDVDIREHLRELAFLEHGFMRIYKSYNSVTTSFTIYDPYSMQERINFQADEYISKYLLKNAALTKPWKSKEDLCVIS